MPLSAVVAPPCTESFVNESPVVCSDLTYSSVTAARGSTSVLYRLSQLSSITYSGSRGIP